MWSCDRSCVSEVDNWVIHELVRGFEVVYALIVLIISTRDSQEVRIAIINDGEENWVVKSLLAALGKVNVL